MDLFQRGNILLTGCSMLVSRGRPMLDMGFIPISRKSAPSCPSSAETALLRDHAAADQEAGRQVPGKSQDD